MTPLDGKERLGMFPIRIPSNYGEDSELEFFGKASFITNGMRERQIANRNFEARGLCWRVWREKAWADR